MIILRLVPSIFRAIPFQTAIDYNAEIMMSVSDCGKYIESRMPCLPAIRVVLTPGDLLLSPVFPMPPIEKIPLPERALPIDSAGIHKQRIETAVIDVC